MRPSPILEQMFVLSQGTNLMGKTEMNITVGTNGLLTTSNTTATSEVVTALENAASAAGTIVGMAGMAAAYPAPAAAPPPNGCPPAGSSYQYLIYPYTPPNEPRPDDPQQTVFCGYTVKWKRAAVIEATHPTPKNSAKFSTSDCSAHSGIFYRHELPYLVTVTGPADSKGNQVVAVSVLTSPNDSEIDFFPIKRSFFANNTANISLTNGVITSVDQTTDGEVTAALSAPAGVLNSYTTAIGSVLTNLTTNSSDTQKLLAQQQATAAAQAQITVCRKTIDSNPLNGLTGSQLTSALAAIKAACPTSQ